MSGYTVESDETRTTRVVATLDGYPLLPDRDSDRGVRQMHPDRISVRIDGDPGTIAHTPKKARRP